MVKPAVSQNACQASQASQASLSVYFKHKYAKPKVTVQRKQQIQGNSEDESDVEQSVCARVNVKGTMPGDVQKHTRVLRPCKARGCCAPPKKLICQDESSSEDEYERNRTMFKVEEVGVVVMHQFMVGVGGEVIREKEVCLPEREREEEVYPLEGEREEDVYPLEGEREEEAYPLEGEREEEV